MNPDQESHLRTLKLTISELLDSKYRIGQQEHGGNVWDRNCLNEAIPEVIDLWVYLITERTKKHQVIEMLRSVITSIVDETMEQQKNVLIEACKLLEGK